ncbi:MAG: hypothetical protein Tsb0027_11350 [Wenzhouxiangellaceae bacterium]
MRLIIRYSPHKLALLLAILTATAQADIAYLQALQNPMQFTADGFRFGAVAVDTETATEIANMDLGFATFAAPVLMAVSADSEEIYVFNAQTLHVIDAHRFLLKRTLQFDILARSMFPLSDNSLLLHDGGGELVRVDAFSGAVLDATSLPVEFSEFIIDRTSSYLYGRSSARDSIMIVNSEQLDNQRVISITDQGPIFGLALTPDESHLLLRNFNVGSPTRLRKIDLESGVDVWFEDDLPGLKLPAGSLNSIVTDYQRGVNILYNSPISTNNKLFTINPDNGSLEILWELPAGIGSVSSNLVVRGDTLLLSLLNNGCPGGPICGLSGHYVYGNLSNNEFILASMGHNDSVVYDTVGSRIIGEDKLALVSVPTLSMGGLTAMMLLLSGIVFYRLRTGRRT